MSSTDSNRSVPTYKILLVGDSYVGKTSLLIRFKDGIFLKGSYISTVGIDFKLKTVTVGERVVKLQIWDTAGQEKFQSLTKSYYRDCNAILLIYDVCDSASFIHVRSWMVEVAENVSNDVLLVIVGNKVDEKERAVSRQEGEQLATEAGALFVETSAKSGFNVENLFRTTADYLLNTEMPPKKGNQNAITLKNKSTSKANGTTLPRNGGVEENEAANEEDGNTMGKLWPGCCY